VFTITNCDWLERWNHTGFVSLNDNKTKHYTSASIKCKSIHSKTMDLTKFIMCSEHLNMDTKRVTAHVKTIVSGQVLSSI